MHVFVHCTHCTGSIKHTPRSGLTVKNMRRGRVAAELLPAQSCSSRVAAAEMQQSCLHGSIDSCPKFPPLPLGIKPISHNLQPFQLTKWTHPSQPPILIISTQNWLGTSLRFFKPERRKQLYILFFCLQPLLIWKNFTTMSIFIQFPPSHGSSKVFNWSVPCRHLGIPLGLPMRSHHSKLCHYSSLWSASCHLELQPGSSSSHHHGPSLP